MVNRRDFLKTCPLLFPGLPVLAGTAHAAPRDIDQAKELLDPGLNLIHHGIKYAKKNKKNNIPPVLREEILENPRAVFIIRTGLNLQKHEDGKYSAEQEQMSIVGYKTAHNIFRKGVTLGGTTYIKPNFVGGFGADIRSLNNGVSTHPSFVIGFCTALKELGNTNIVICANGATTHEQFVQSGICEMMHNSGICFTEGGRFIYKWRDYKNSEITWVDYPEGIVMRKIPFLKLVKEKDTTLINIAKTRTHIVAALSLAIKNFQGTMPVGYMHICNPWSGEGYGAQGTWSITNAMNLQSSDEIFNPQYQKEIEQLYIKHAQIGYKYWDEDGHAKAYFDAGGWEAFQKGEFKPNLRLFWGEQWAQRMIDVNMNVNPYINLVEGIVGIDGANNLHLNNFITISRSRVECDSVTAWMMGHDPRELPFLRIANERGLGDNNIEQIVLYEITNKGIEKINDFKTLPRARMGTRLYNYGDTPLRFF